MKNYFTVDEIICPCGCGMVWDENFHMTMNAIRKEVGFPVIINSGARCVEYDRHIGGKGPHTTGKAADVRCSGRKAHAILVAAALHGITGFGVNQKDKFGARFLHLDQTEGETRPWVWSY